MYKFVHSRCQSLAPETLEHRSNDPARLIKSIAMDGLKTQFKSFMMLNYNAIWTVMADIRGTENA